MISLEELKVLLKGLEDAPPCVQHARGRLEICEDCGSVLCLECRGCCQCMNDE